MRHLTKEMRERFIRKQICIERGWKKRRQFFRKNISREKRRLASKYVPAIHYFAPRVVAIDDPNFRTALLVFLSDIRRHFLELNDRTAVLNFSKTEQFVAGGTLLLYAELNRLITYSPAPVKLRCTEPANVKGSEVLKQVGIYRLCGSKCSVKPCREDVVHWQVAQGQLVDNSLCAPAIEGFQQQLSGEMVDELLGGLGEAMTNAIHHAYDGVRLDGMNFQSKTDWWMFSQAKDGKLSVVFCDLGIGIPASLPKKRPNLYEQILFRHPIPTDSDCIQEAIIEGRTRTKLDGRGYGLGNIIDVVENIDGGVVVVYSNAGRYDSRANSPHPRDYADSILGTVICWNVPLNKAGSEV